MIQKVTITFWILMGFSFLICKYAPSDNYGWGDAIQGGFLVISVLGSIICTIACVWLLYYH